MKGNGFHLKRRGLDAVILPVSFLSFLFLAIGSWGFIILVDGADLFELLSIESFKKALGFLQQLLGIGGKQSPAFFQASKWSHAIVLARDTLVMSILAIGLASIIASLTIMPSARNIAFGELTPAPKYWRAVFILFRGIYLLTRSIPELIWAMMIIFLLNPGIVTGSLALAAHNLGILGKLGSEVIEDMDPAPARSLRGNGANNGQLFLYGVLPMVLPQLLTYLLYRWEVIIRATIVVGFVAAGGLGYEFRLHMSFFRYTDITLLLAVYLLLVWMVDIVSVGLRKLAR